MVMPWFEQRLGCSGARGARLKGFEAVHGVYRADFVEVLCRGMYRWQGMHFMAVQVRFMLRFGVCV